MESLKVIRAKVAQKIEEEKEKNEKRKNLDITQYLEDAQSKYLMAILLLVISKDKFYINRSEKNGKHSAMEEEYLGNEKVLEITEGEPRYYLPKLMADKLGMVVVEFGGLINGGIITVSYPDDINDYQLDILQDVCTKIENVNNNATDDIYKYKVVVVDPDTGHTASSLQEVIDKLRGRNRSI